MFKMDLDKLFKPKSMAVVGISKKNPLSPGRIVMLKNEFEMQVKVYGIYPSGGEIEGIPLYEKLENLPEIPDLLVIAVGPDDTIDYIQNCVDLHPFDP